MACSSSVQPRRRSKLFWLAGWRRVSACLLKPVCRGSQETTTTFGRKKTLQQHLLHFQVRFNTGGVVHGAGTVVEWQGRLGELNAENGQFQQCSGAAASSTAGASAGFCGFLGAGPVYVGAPSMDAVCQHLGQTPGLTVSWGTRVRPGRNPLPCALFLYIMVYTSPCLVLHTVTTYLRNKQISVWWPTTCCLETHAC